MENLFRKRITIKSYDAQLFKDLTEVANLHQVMQSPRRASAYCHTAQVLSTIEEILEGINSTALEAIYSWLISSQFNTKELYNLIKDDRDPWLLHVLTGWDKNLIRFMNNVYNAIMDNSHTLIPGDTDIEALGRSDTYHGMLIVPFMRDLCNILSDMVHDVARASRSNRDLSDISLLDLFREATVYSYARIIMLGFKYGIIEVYDESR